MNRVTIFFLVFIIACSDKEVRKTYYPDGIVEEINEFVNGKKNGMARSYHKNGVISYEGEYKDNQRIGWHNYYTVEGKVKHKTFWSIVYGKELALKNVTLDGEGNVIGEVSFAKKDLQITSDREVYYLGDTIRLRIRILNPTFKYCKAALGIFDENLNVLKYTGELQFIEGDLEHKVSMRILLTKAGADTVTGLIRDYDFRYQNDSTGLVLGEDSFFSFPIEVKQPNPIGVTR
jgi:hypothetical protein